MGDKEFDKSAYVLYHSAQTGFPCLSFDVVPDDDGCGEERLDRDKLSLILVTGTQAPRANQNAIHALRFSELKKFRKKRRGGGDDSEEDEEDEEDESDSDDDNENPDLQPILRAIDIPHPWGEINRIRYTQFGPSGLIALWCSSGCVRIYDITRSLFELKDLTIARKEHAIQPYFAFSGHPTEGFGIGWSTVSPGYLATGDCYKNIHIWKPRDGGTWHVDQTPLIGHEASVEDIQWSPTEDKILASCSVDKSIKIWDIRKPALSSCILNMKEAHDCDVNVISWNHKDPAFLLSGGDDGILKVWDFRKFSNSSQRASPIATFKYHCTPITSLEWDPDDASVFISSGEDQVNIWDLSVEEDEESLQLNRNGVKQESEKMDCGENDNDNESSEDDDEEEDEDEEDDEERKQMREEEEEMSRKYGDVPPQLLFIHEGQKEVKEIHFHPQIPGLIISTSADSFDIFKTISN